MSGAEARSDAPVAEDVSGSGGGGHSTAAAARDRKPGGGVLKRLKSRRSQVDSRPVTEEELRTQSDHITPEDVLGLRVATRGLMLFLIIMMMMGMMMMMLICLIMHVCTCS